MQWYEKIKNKLESEKSYSHKELMEALKQDKPDLTDSTYHWAISGLIRDGILVRKGYDASCRIIQHKEICTQMINPRQLGTVKIFNNL